MRKNSQSENINQLFTITLMNSISRNMKMSAFCIFRNG